MNDKWIKAYHSRIISGDVKRDVPIRMKRYEVVQHGPMTGEFSVMNRRHLLDKRNKHARCYLCIVPASSDS